MFTVEETAYQSERAARLAHRVTAVSRGRSSLTVGRAYGTAPRRLWICGAPQTAGDSGKARTVPARMGWVNESGK